MSELSRGLEYGGIAIRDRGEMLSLTDMWRAAGAEPAKQPAKWRELPSTLDFAGHIASVILGKSEDDVFMVKRGGREPSTWAHWQLGIAYAKYLSPAFHAWANQAVRDRMEGRVGRPEDVPVPLDAKTTGGVMKSVVHAALEAHLLPLHAGIAELTARLNDMAEGRVTDPAAAPAREFISALGYLESRAWPQAGRRGMVVAISARLQRFCTREGHPMRFSAEKGTRLFHVDAVAAWEAAEGRTFLAACRDRVAGQGRLRLDRNGKAGPR